MSSSNFSNSGFSSSENPNEPKTIKTSVAAVTSMTFGIMSPIVLCSCLPSIVTSLCAIVLGHIALVKIKNSNGELVGRNRAITGLAIGYPFLIISLWLSPMFFSRIDNYRATIENVRERAAANSSSAGYASDDALRQAERKIVFSRKTAANGNDPDGVIMARELSQSLEQLRDVLLVSSDGGDEHKGKFLTYCQNREGSICFLVFVPEFRKYEGEAKDAIASAAWLAATNVVKANGHDEDCELAVGLKGNLLYGSVMIGRANQNSPSSSSKSRGRLERFFTN